MIPKDNITAWRVHAPWRLDAQVEQGLVISRAIVNLFAVPELARSLVFRGGKALYKIYLRPPARYSEDITREHFTELGVTQVPFEVANSWFSGAADVPTYALDELLCTKLRALFQRKKGRDLFDLWYALDQGRIDPETLLACFVRYMAEDGRSVTRAQFEESLAGKRKQPDLRDDVGPILRPGFSWDFDVAMDAVLENLVARLPGDPWKGEEQPAKR